MRTDTAVRFTSVFDFFLKTIYSYHILQMVTAASSLKKKTHRGKRSQKATEKLTNRYREHSISLKIGMFAILCDFKIISDTF